MSTYVIGDVQGCYDQLMELLTVIAFDSSKDRLWFTGDLVNRGTHSLEVLRFIKSLGKAQQTVLGNHDLHLLATAHGGHKGHTDDTLQPIFAAQDKAALLTWLSEQPLFYYEKDLDYCLVHAGIAPSWDLSTCLSLSREVENTLQDPVKAQTFYLNMYGDKPDLWEETLEGMDRLRCITSYFTRMRYCYADGRMELKEKGSPKHHVKTIEKKPAPLIPWFKLADRKNKNLKILFGHWAALGGITNTENVYALDTGCIWGFCLTAMRLEDQKRFSVPCHKI